MSEQAAPAGAPPEEAGAPPRNPGAGADPYKIHDLALEASKKLEAIATALGHADAPEKTTASFTKMADACRELAGAMSRAPAPEEAAPAAPAGRETMDTATNDLAAQAQRR